MLMFLLDYSLLIVAVSYTLITLFRFSVTKHSVLDTDKVQTAYFNIMWNKKEKRG